MKIIFHGPMRPGDVSTQRLEALERVPGLEIIRSPSDLYPSTRPVNIARSVAWRARVPFDSMKENPQLLKLARAHRPDAIIAYNSRTLTAGTLRRIRRETSATLAYIAPDDVISSHNQTRWLRTSFPVWDVFFTSKSYNVPELKAAGVKRPILNENIFDPRSHYPMTPAEVGEEFEKFDFVFVGTFEADRADKLRALAEAGFSVLVQGNAAGRLAGSWQRLADAGATIRPAAVDLDYTRAVHKGKVALGFLRKMNRDLITHRSIELPAMGRPMLAEKTVEHDSHLADREEYVGFSSDQEMIEKAHWLMSDETLRRRIGKAARERCLSSGYSADDDMKRIVSIIAEAKSGNGAKR